MQNKKITELFSHKKKTDTKIKHELPTCSKSDTKDLEDLEALKAFDLTLEYGPCIGITRMERWKRAEKHGLNPPMKVKEILESHDHEEVFKQRRLLYILILELSFYGKIREQIEGWLAYKWDCERVLCFPSNFLLNKWGWLVNKQAVE